MPLRFDLGPFEKLFVGKTILTNGGERTMFVVEGEGPILRAKDVLSAQLAATHLEKLYCCVQQMYLEEDFGHTSNWRLVRFPKTRASMPNLTPPISW